MLYKDVYDFPRNLFVVWDYVVFALILVISAVVGLYSACKESKNASAKEFLLADKNMSVFPVALSLIASFISALTLLNVPAETAIFGTKYLTLCISQFFVILVSSLLYVPVFYRLNVTSVFEYIEKRFNRPLRVFASAVFIIQTLLYMALALYAPCLALSVVTGIDKWTYVFSVGVVCIFYTTIGGMKAVLWTDMIQIVFIYAGMAAVFGKGCTEFGFNNMWETMREHGRIEFWDPDPRLNVRHTFWSLFFGGIFSWLSIYAVNQSQIQRLMCTPSVRKAQIAVWMNFPGFVVLLFLCSLCGFVIFFLYHACDPILTKRAQIKEQYFPLVVMERMNYPGFPGFIIACIFSGSLSTISSGLNSLAAVILKDIIQLSCAPKLSDKRTNIMLKIISALCGGLMIALTLIVSQMGDVLQAGLSIFGMLGGPLLGLFTLGMFYPWANAKGGIIGFFISLCIILWIGVGNQIYKPDFAGDIPPPVTADECHKWYPLKNLTNSNFTTLYPFNSSLSTDSFYTMSTSLPHNSTLKPPKEESIVMMIYQLSYLWYSALATLIAVIVGLITSFLTGYTRPSELDPLLLSPLVHQISKILPEKLKLVKNDYELETVEDVEVGVNEVYKHRADEAYDNFSYALEAHPDEPKYEIKKIEKKNNEDYRYDD